MRTMDDLLVIYGEDKMRAFMTALQLIENATGRVAYAQEQFGRAGNEILAIVAAEQKSAKCRAVTAAVGEEMTAENATKIFLLCEFGDALAEPYGMWHVIGWGTDRSYLEFQAARLEVLKYEADMAEFEKNGRKGAMPIPLTQRQPNSRHFFVEPAVRWPKT